jgi:hypothetical protein
MWDTKEKEQFARQTKNGTPVLASHGYNESKHLFRYCTTIFLVTLSVDVVIRTKKVPFAQCH